MESNVKNVFAPLFDKKELEIKWNIYLPKTTTSSTPKLKN
jgi:hypothetical protein